MRLRLAWGVLAWLVLGAMPAAAQPLLNSLTGAFRADAGTPVVVEADTLTLDASGEEAVFEGRVVARQGLLTMEARRAKARFAAPSGGAVRSLRAEGAVAFRAGAEASVEGAWAEYDVVAQRLEVGGEPVTLRRGRDVLAGRHLMLDLATGRGTLTGGRVRGVLAPAR